MIGPAGGMLELPMVGSLDIPAGALTEMTMVRMSRVDAPEAGTDPLWTSDAVRLEPDGLRFALPVTLTLRYDPAGLPEPEYERDQMIFRVDTPEIVVAGDMVEAPEGEGDAHDFSTPVIDTDGRTISVELMHFSDYAAGAPVGNYGFETILSGAEALPVLRYTGATTYVDMDGLVTRGRLRAAAEIQYLVIHHTSQTGTLRAQFAQGHRRARDGSASAHFWIGRNGVIAQVADPRRLISHAGGANTPSIGIELVNNDREAFPLAQLLATRRLVSFLAHQFNLPLRGRRVDGFSEPADVRLVDRRYQPNRGMPPAGSVAENFDRVLGHMEVDRHKFLVRAEFVAAPAMAAQVRFTANRAGHFVQMNGWNCGTGWGASVPAGTAFDIPFNAGALMYGNKVCFRPDSTTITALDDTFEITARLVDAGGMNVAPANDVEVGLDQGAADLTGAVRTMGAMGQPRVYASRRRRDPGGGHDFDWERLLTSLDHDFTGIINTAGGDAYGEARPGDGGNVIFASEVAFAGGHFNDADELYLNSMDPPGDEATQMYSLVVNAGTTHRLPAAMGVQNFVWLVVNGTLELSGPTQIRASGGIYLGPEGRIVAHDGMGGGRDGFDVTLETLGEALIYGLIDAEGEAAPEMGASGPGGHGGDVTVRMLGATQIQVPTIITRGGDADDVGGAAPISPSGGTGGRVQAT